MKTPCRGAAQGDPLAGARHVCAVDPRPWKQEPT